LRVTARIVKEESWEGELMRASMVAPPCWPVAPVMRRALDIVGFCSMGLVCDGCLWLWRMFLFCADIDLRWEVVVLYIYLDTVLL
jgi:hypothetical protein